MTTRDGIGSPRRPDVVARDALAIEIIQRRAEEGKCTRLGDLRKELPQDLTRGQVHYVIRRLNMAGLIERRAGYLWCVPDES